MAVDVPPAVSLLASAAGAALVVTAWIALRMRALRPHVTTSAAPRGGVSLQLARDRAAVVDILRSWDHEVGGRGERATDVSLQLLDLDAALIWGYCSTFALAGLAAIAGLGLEAGWLAPACTAWLAAVTAMGRADAIENTAMAQLLRAGPDHVRSGRHDATIRRMGAAARLKFTLFVAELLACVALWIILLRR